MADGLATHLASNLRQLRAARGLSQLQAADSAGLPRPTWTTLESGSANPTLTVLARAASALQVSVEELIGPPRDVGRLFTAAMLRTRRRGAVTVRDLLPETLPGVQIERIELPAGGSLVGVPHTPGTREYLTCERGRIELATSGHVYTLGAGDVVVFRGDQRHSYRNPKPEPAIGYSVVTLIAPAR